MINIQQQLVRLTELTGIFLIACSKFAPKSIHQIARFQFQKYKISQLLRGHIPQYPCRACALDAPGSPSGRCPWTPPGTLEWAPGPHASSAHSALLFGHKRFWFSSPSNKSSTRPPPLLPMHETRAWIVWKIRIGFMHKRYYDCTMQNHIKDLL